MSHCASGPIVSTPTPIPEKTRPIMVACRCANHCATSAPLGTQPTAEMAVAVSTPVTR
jgi:hypothetical protein